jgi:hypothetical protein
MLGAELCSSGKLYEIMISLILRNGSWSTDLVAEFPIGMVRITMQCNAARDPYSIDTKLNLKLQGAIDFITHAD